MIVRIHFALKYCFLAKMYHGAKKKKKIKLFSLPVQQCQASSWQHLVHHEFEPIHHSVLNYQVGIFPRAEKLN